MPCDVTEIEKAYKKLKASVYYDKTQLALRNRIVTYEEYCVPRFQGLVDMLNTPSPRKWNQQKKVIKCPLCQDTIFENIMTSR